MTDHTRIGKGNCPECGRQTVWQNGEHLCSECGVIEGDQGGNGPKKRDKTCMMFKHDKAYQQLREHGMVETVRTSQKERGPVWISRGYPGKGYGKECEAWREKGSPIDPRKDYQLKPYVKDSGFPSLEAWRDKIRENGPTDELPEKAYRHRVHLKKISIKQYFWANYDDGGPDGRGILSFISPHQGNQITHVMAMELPEVVVHVVGDSSYEKVEGESK